MSNSAGDITFGVGADISGLQKAIAMTQAFGRETDKVVRLQEKGSSALVNAYNRQEQAMRRALATSANLQRQLRKVDADPNILGQSTKSLNAYISSLSKGALNSVAFTRATEKYNQTTLKLKNVLAGLQPPEEKVRNFTTLMKDLESASVLAVGPLSGVGSRIRALGAIFDRTTVLAAGTIAGFTGTGAGLYYMAKAGITAEMSMNKVMAGLEFVSGSAASAQREFKLVSETANKYGLNLQEVAQQYSQFAAATKNTALEGEGARKVFEGMATAARALQLNNEQVSGTLLAFTQMLSKGTVQAEELRGQVGERIPGAFRMAAEAMGMTTQELEKQMKAGNVMAADMLPKLADLWLKTFGTQAQKNSEQLSANIEKLRNTVFTFNVAFDQTFGLSEKFNGVIKTATNTLKFFADNMDNIKKVIGSVAYATAGFGAVMATVFVISKWQNIALGIMYVVDALKVLRTAELTAAGAASLFAGPAGIGAFVTGVAAITATVGGAVYGFNKMSEAIEQQHAKQAEFSTRSSEATQAFITDQKNKQTASKATTKAYIDDINKQIEAAQAQYNLLAGQFQALDATVRNSDTRDRMGNKVVSAAQQNALNDKAAQLGKLHGSILQARQQLADLDKLYVTAPDNIDTGGSGVLSDKAAKKAERLKEALEPLENTLARIKALDTGPLEVIREEQNEKVQKFADALQKAGASQELINQKTLAYSQALKELDAAEKRFKAWEDFFSQAGSEFDTFFSNLTDNTKSFSTSWKTMVNSLIGDLERFIIKMSIVEPIKQGLMSSGIFSGVGNFFSGIFGGTASSGSTSTTVSLGASELFPNRATGGQIQSGKGYIVGENGPEPFFPGTPGRILPTDSLGSNVVVNIINNSNASASVKETTNSNGRSIDVTIDDMIAKQLASPGTRSNRAVRNTMSTGIVGR